MCAKHLHSKNRWDVCSTITLQKWQNGSPISCRFINVAQAGIIFCLFSIGIIEFLEVSRAPIATSNPYKSFLEKK